ncbi:hypothetical protein KEM56_006412 [Ascosphaera pollenicola]|nr:hypothetical protein KEM56_006412 [Ascosphaera pollenicola]
MVNSAYLEHHNLTLPLTTDPPGPNNPPKQAVWVIFGVTGHMGRSLAKAALAHGDLVAGAGRTFENTSAEMKGLMADNQDFLGLLCDVRAPKTIQHVLDKTLERWGRIDIVANCSGYGVIGSCEDQEEYDIRNQFETNFMAVFNIIQLALPFFRERQYGRFIIFSSTTATSGTPGLGPYCASKYAVEGLIESLLYEVDCYNIKGILVEPGYIRRDEPCPTTLLSRPSNDVLGPLPSFGHFLVKPASQPYSSASSPAAHARRVIQWLGEEQPTSVRKSAELVWQLGHCLFPPLRLLLGSYAVECTRDRLKYITEEIEEWKHLNFAPNE